MGERMEARNVTLHPSDWVLVDAVAERSGVRSTSGGLRVLIAEYRALARQAAERMVGLKVDDPQVQAAVRAAATTVHGSEGDGVDS